MKFTILALVLGSFAANVECMPPFHFRTTPAALPDDPNFFKKFEAIPPKTVTADKLIENFFGGHAGSRGKRQAFDDPEDGVAVLDASGSISTCEFKRGRRAMRNMMKITVPNVDYKYAGVVYSNVATRRFNFLPGNQAADKIDTTSYIGGGTNTADGLAKARDLFNDPSAGGRGRFARQMVFLVTDGQSTINEAQTLPIAAQLKRRRVEIFVVAIGKFQNNLKALKEMANVATYPPENYLYRVENYNGFVQIVKLVIERMGLDYIRVVGNLPPPC